MHSCVIAVLLLTVGGLCMSFETYSEEETVPDLQSACKWSEEHRACSGYCNGVETCIQYEPGVCGCIGCGFDLGHDACVGSCHFPSLCLLTKGNSTCQCTGCGYHDTSKTSCRGSCSSGRVCLQASTSDGCSCSGHGCSYDYASDSCVGTDSCQSIYGEKCKRSKNGLSRTCLPTPLLSLSMSDPDARLTAPFTIDTQALGHQPIVGSFRGDLHRMDILYSDHEGVEGLRDAVRVFYVPEGQSPLMLVRNMSMPVGTCSVYMPEIDLAADEFVLSLYKFREYLPVMVERGILEVTGRTCDSGYYRDLPIVRVL
ncbi:hypothetical protein KIPB_010095 [Kipferlia bialata]|uniref:Uncharacterized protein n=1 Tax=Kipferlia bialata TaxID=797122 RepID=A0A9K3D3C8_9EUKA|nr:hypothetical protein KIPB_010095 [Kipferlia bialata]|eukprot:g10095.t1